ncbi:MAG TPA: hypothetical protein DEP84_19715, partial [Chloroflexi bacterium]|nr:hypothetical protein [Chloroflexota bacterium]
MGRLVRVGHRLETPPRTLPVAADSNVQPGRHRLVHLVRGHLSRCTGPVFENVEVTMLEQLERLKQQALAELGSIEQADALDEWRQRYLGRKGELTTILRGLGQLPKEERPAVGQAANEVKLALETALAERE